jgi:hypothetical protein
VTIINQSNDLNVMRYYIKCDDGTRIGCNSIRTLESVQ